MSEFRGGVIMTLIASLSRTASINDSFSAINRNASVSTLGREVTIYAISVRRGLTKLESIRP
jgi:hypothetical protein